LDRPDAKTVEGKYLVHVADLATGGYEIPVIEAEGR
jgi:hypothetical protein